MTIGDTINLEHDLGVEGVRAKVGGLVGGMADARLPANIEFHIFLPGGLPFLSGTLDDFYEAVGNSACNHRLYVVVTRRLGDLSTSVLRETCDCTKAILLSPLYECTREGIADIGCFIGYLQHSGAKAEHMLLVFAKITRFAPLISSVYRLLEGEEVIGLNIVSVTGPLHTLCRSLLPSRIGAEHVLQYCLKVLSFISLCDRTDFLQLYASNWDADTDETQAIEAYCRRTNQQHHFVIWEEDTRKPGFAGYEIVIPAFEVIEHIFESVLHFKPVSPRTLHHVFSAVLFRGSRNTCLFLGEVPGCRNFVRLIDPYVDASEQNIDDLAQAVHNDDIDPLFDIIDNNRADQAIEVCIDSSLSMQDKFDGLQTKGDVTKSRLYWAKEYLGAFTDRTYSYRLASAYGLFQFNSIVTELCPLSYNTSRFIGSVLKVSLEAGTVLWDAIDAACDSLIGYNQVHPKARLRVIVITDGQDEGSKKTLGEVLDKLVKNAIVLDSVMLSSQPHRRNKEIWTLCKMSGGLAFRSAGEREGLALFEQEAFLNIKMRKCSCVTSDTSRGEMIEVSQGFTAAGWATEAVNHGLIEARQQFPLAVPLFAIRQGMRAPTPDAGQQRFGRILRELKYIMNHIDGSITIFVHYQSIDKIRGFFQGPEGRFWSIFVTFPVQYPIHPPFVRFTNIPYHPNISSEGRALFGLVEHDYHPEVTVCQIIERAKAILAEPELQYALQRGIRDECNDKPGEYARKAREVAEREGKLAIADFDFAPPQVPLYTERSAPDGLTGLDDVLVSQIGLGSSTPMPIMMEPELDWF
jgi:ubiquitin-protein ligase